MTNFVYDNTALPAAKSDAFPVSDATRQWAAADGNACFTGLEDIRTILEHRTFNVAAYGAVGDGVTNDAPAIALAIAAAQTAQLSGQVYGAYVEFPKGIFVCNTPISIPNGVGLRGAGPTATIIRAGATFNASALIQNAIQDGTQEFAFLEGLQVQGNKGGGAICSVAVVNFVSLFINSYIRDVVILNGSNYGLRIAASGNPGGMGPVMLHNVWVDGCTNHNFIGEEDGTNVGACAGLVAYNLTSEHQGSNASAIYLKGLGHCAQWNFYNTHMEMGNAATGRTGITIDGVAHVRFHGTQLLCDPATLSEGIKITNAVQNVGIEFNGVYNPNLANPLVRDLKNSTTVGAINIDGRWVTPDAKVRGGMRFIPEASGVSAAWQDSAGVDRAWFDATGALTGLSSLGGAGLDIKADATNNRGWSVQSNAAGNVYEWIYPSGGGGVLRERYRTGNLDVRQIGTDASQFFYAALTCQAAVLCQSTLRINGNIGFFNTAPAAKPTVTGSRGGNAALASLLTALAGLGLLTDSSSA